MAQLSDYSSGDVPTAAEINAYWTHTGGSFPSWSPTATHGGAALSVTVLSAVWRRSGRLVQAWATLRLGTVSSGDFAVSLPVEAARAGDVVGLIAFTDVDGVQRPAFTDTTTSVKFREDNSVVSDNLQAVGTGDVVSVVLFYEALEG